MFPCSVAGYGPNQPGHSGWFLPGWEEYGVVAGECPTDTYT